MENENNNSENGLDLAGTANKQNELIWESNHLKIARAIHGYTKENGTKPSIGQVAQATGLSRQTVDKHIKAFDENECEDDALNMYSLMREHLIANTYRQASGGDLSATKLFLDATDKRRRTKRSNTKNNFVQINNTVINQQFIQQFKPEQLDRIEQLIAAELHAIGVNKKG